MSAARKFESHVGDVLPHGCGIGREGLTDNKNGAADHAELMLMNAE